MGVAVPTTSYLLGSPDDQVWKEGWAPANPGGRAGEDTPRVPAPAYRAAAGLGEGGAAHWRERGGGWEPGPLQPQQVCWAGHSSRCGEDAGHMGAARGRHRAEATGAHAGAWTRAQPRLEEPGQPQGLRSRPGGCGPGLGCRRALPTSRGRPRRRAWAPNQAEWQAEGKRVQQFEPK